MIRDAFAFCNLEASNFVITSINEDI